MKQVPEPQQTLSILVNSKKEVTAISAVTSFFEGGIFLISN